MARHLHARRRRKRMFYRVWSTITDAYDTAPGAEEQVRTFLLFEYVTQVIDQLNREFPKMLERARQRGTSDPQDEQDLDDPWATEVPTDKLPKDMVEDYNRRMELYRQDLEHLLAHWKEIV